MKEEQNLHAFIHQQLYRETVKRQHNKIFTGNIYLHHLIAEKSKGEKFHLNFVNNFFFEIWKQTKLL